jgi:hypothetical protein
MKRKEKMKHKITKKTKVGWPNAATGLSDVSPHATLEDFFYFISFFI